MQEFGTYCLNSTDRASSLHWGGRFSTNRILFGGAFCTTGAGAPSEHQKVLDDNIEKY